jgi:hypothetical protein
MYVCTYERMYVCMETSFIEAEIEIEIRIVKNSLGAN